MSYLFQVRGALPPQSWPWPLSQTEVARLTEEILSLCEPALAAAGDAIGRPYGKRTDLEVQRFLEVYARRPLTANRHGSGFNDSLWLWLIARWLEPELLLESGSFMGHSAWLFRQACPAARIETHDVELPPAGRLRTPGVVYRLQDWSEVETGPFEPERALCFFDDHISHALRLEQAAGRGFRLALFDDNFPAWQLHATGAPPVPSLAMLEDSAGSIDPVIINPVEWQRNRKHYAYESSDVTGSEHEKIMALVQASYRFPDLATVTRLPPGSNLTLVRLRPC